MIATKCIEDVIQVLKDTGVFLDQSGKQKVVQVEDTGHLVDMSAKVNYPFCGVIYEGATPVQGAEDFGTGVDIRVACLILVDSKIRYYGQTVNRVSIDEILDSVRGGIIRRLSPTGHVWVFGGEYPLDLGKSGLVYYQSWTTRGTL